MVYEDQHYTLMVTIICSLLVADRKEMAGRAWPSLEILHFITFQSGSFRSHNVLASKSTLTNNLWKIFYKLVIQSITT